jgi:HSP20 family protein
MKSLMRWDPFHLMGRGDPFDEFRSMQREMDRLFSRVLGVGISRGQTSDLLMPAVESYTKDGQLIFRTELPGVDPRDLDVSITDRELVIKGERKQEKDAKETDYAYREISYGSFERHFALPEGVKTEALKATFNNGILEVSVPAPANPTARKIEIETAKGSAQISNETAKKAA